jgi:bacterioferritin
MDSRPNFTSIEVIRARARSSLESGAVTASYGADRDTVLEQLDRSLATEIVCALRYRRHYFMAVGLAAEPAAAEFLEHANQEQQHADSIAARIVQLGGKPDFSPATLVDRSHAEYVAGQDLEEMLREDLIAERIAIQAYTEFIRYLGDGDPTTRNLIESILAVEEEHAEDLNTLLSGGAGRQRQARNETRGSDPASLVRERKS